MYVTHVASLDTNKNVISAINSRRLEMLVNFRSDPGAEGLVRSLVGALPAFQDTETIEVPTIKHVHDKCWTSGPINEV